MNPQLGPQTPDPCSCFLLSTQALEGRNELPRMGTYHRCKVSGLSLAGGDAVLDICLLQSLHCLHNRKQLRHVVIPEDSVSIRPCLSRSPKPRVPALLRCGRALLYLTCLSLPAPAEAPWELFPQPDPRVGVVRRLGEVTQGREVNMGCVCVLGGGSVGAGLTSPVPGHSCTASPPVGERGQCVSQQYQGGYGVLVRLAQALANAGHSPHTARACFQGLQQSRKIAGWPQRQPQGACPLALAPAPFHQPTQGLTL